MLEGMLFDDVQLGAVRRRNSGSDVSGVYADLRSASAGLRNQAAGRERVRNFRNDEGAVNARDAVARPAPVAAAPSQKERAAFEDSCNALARGISKLTQTEVSALVEVLPSMFSGSAKGAAALRQYWIELGYPAADVDANLAAAAKAGDKMSAVARQILEAPDWDKAIAQFGAGNPDPLNWGFAYVPEGQIHPTVLAFVVTCRDAGITASVYVLYSITSLLCKMAEEIGARPANV